MKGKGDRRREARRQKSKNLQRCMVFALVSATALIAAIQLTMFTSPGDQPSDAGADLGSRNLKGSAAHSMEYNMEYPEVLETAPAVDLTPPQPAGGAPDPVSQLPLNSMYRLSATTIDGETMDLSSLVGKVTLVVNVASK